MLHPIEGLPRRMFGVGVIGDLDIQPSQAKLRNPAPVAEFAVKEPNRAKIMNTLIRWNPFREFETMTNRMSSIFPRPPLTWNIDETLNTSEWSPLVDVEENDKEYTIKAELPEVKKEDVKIQVENGSLRISGERKLEKEESGRRFHRLERSYGAFERSFSLPEGTRKNDVSAEFKDGLLRVHLPKGEIAKPMALEIPVS